MDLQTQTQIQNVIPFPAMTNEEFERKMVLPAFLCRIEA